MREVTWKDRFRYRFDIIMARGTIALMGWLTIASVVMIVTISMFVKMTGAIPAEDGKPAPTLGHIAWMSLMRTLDAGTMGGDDGSALFLGAMLAVTFGGIFIVSTLIGILTSGIESRLDELRKGRSFVVEEDHVVILGFSPHIFTLISELVTANANKPYGCIVVLADKDKVEMEDEIKAKVGDFKTTRVVCRTGSPTDVTDLELTNLSACKAIVVLATEGAHGDTHVIKTLMALINNPDRRKEPYHIVAEVGSARAAAVAKLVGGDEVEVVVGDEMISRITVQASRQSGLSLVYTELLDFDGDEIYFQEEPGLVGKTFGQAMLSAEESTIIGIIDAKNNIHLRPPADTKINAGDRVIAVSEDDDTVKLSGKADVGVQADAIVDPKPRTLVPEATLILGWNGRGNLIVSELEDFSPPGSKTTIVSADPAAAEAVSVFQQTLSRQSISLVAGDTTDPTTLAGLDVAQYQHIMVLSHGDAPDEEEADARTLITLLYLRDLAKKVQGKFSITSEMLDVRNRALAEATRADDFIVSDKLVSLLLSQYTENKQLSGLFAQLFDPKTAELSLRPVTEYVKTGVSLNFYTLVEAARRRGEVALGYRIASRSNDPTCAYGVTVNPEKSERITYTPEDKVIVIAHPDMEEAAPELQLPDGHG